MKKQMILWTCMLLLVLVGCKKDDVQYTDRYELKGKVERTFCQRIGGYGL